MSKTGKELASFAKTKLGTPYVYGAKGADGPFTLAKFNFLAKNYPNVFTASYKVKARKFIGRVCCDCSGLISWYTGKVLGSSQLYAQAYARLPMSKIKDFAIGTVLWKSGHVGVYCGLDKNGNPICIEAKGIDYGTVEGIVSNPNRWSYGLTFSWMDYDIKTKVPSNEITYKGTNPYPKPRVLLKYGSTGEYVKWLQWELIESGFGEPFEYYGKTYPKITIDGQFGSITRAAVCKYQKSCKLEVDGEVGPLTRNSLANVTDNKAK